MSGPKIVTRKEAKELNLTRYFTGKPCVNGHIAERSVSNRGCCVCDCVRRFRLYHAESLEERIKRSREYYYRNLEKCRKSSRERQKRNWAHKLEYMNKWKENNPEKVKKWNDHYYKFGPSKFTGETQWLTRNRALLRSVKRALRSNNPYEALQSLSKELQQVNSSQR